MKTYSKEILYPLIPHKNEMFWIDNIIDDENNKIGVVNYQTNRLYHKNGFSQVYFIEFMAQAFALSTALFISRAITEGFLISVDSFQVFHFISFQNNDQLQIHTKEMNRIDEISVVEGKIYFGEQIIAQAQFKTLGKISQN